MAVVTKSEGKIFEIAAIGLFGMVPMRVRYHSTKAKNNIADTWRNSNDEGEDLKALFDHQKKLHEVEQERLALDAESRSGAERPIARTTRRV